jgi:hypothetical protein
MYDIHLVLVILEKERLKLIVIYYSMIRMVY